MSLENSPVNHRLNNNNREPFNLANSQTQSYIFADQMPISAVVANEKSNDELEMLLSENYNTQTLLSQDNVKRLRSGLEITRET